jgi:hypothetical protein
MAYGEGKRCGGRITFAQDHDHQCQAEVDRGSRVDSLGQRTWSTTGSGAAPQVQFTGAGAGAVKRAYNLYTARKESLRAGCRPAYGQPSA